MKANHVSATSQLQAQPEAVFATCQALVNALAARADPAWDRFSYLASPDEHQEPKIPFADGLLAITGLHTAKGALSSFSKFLMEAQNLSKAERESFLQSRADQWPPVRCHPYFEPSWWDYGGFLKSEVPTLQALYRPWASAKRHQNLKAKKAQEEAEKRPPQRKIA